MWIAGVRDVGKDVFIRSGAGELMIMVPFCSDSDRLLWENGGLELGAMAANEYAVGARTFVRSEFDIAKSVRFPPALAMAAIELMMIASVPGLP